MTTKEPDPWGRLPDLSQPAVAGLGIGACPAVEGYEILRVLGEGGMGVVYLARQKAPLQRLVALKIVKPGMDSQQVIARFEAERQALALLDHPHIASIYEAGTTKDAHPYFAMEYVQGIPITEYCDRYKLGTQERLRLFLPLCEAIQHAHQKGIIHRDIKPSNVLVMRHEDQPIPKVIDFGVAKALHQRLTEKTLVTEKGEFLGTPEYMSPEQAELTGLDVDTRTDIYSLGVLLYELLTGCTPFDAQDLRSKGYAEMQRILCEQDPVKPSTKLTTLGSKLEDIAQHRSATGDQLRKSVRGDLDWIVMKTLEKDRTRRYETANGLAVDIEHHLNNEPVTARPPSNLYRFQKLVRRNQGVFVGVAVVAAVLVLGALVSTWQAIRATQATRAESRLREQAEANALAMRQIAYAADMSLTQQALAMNDLGRARRLLESHRPAPGEVDLRGWEWRYLWQECQSDALYCLCQKPNEINSLAVSYDGNWLAIGEQNNGGLSVWDLRTRQPTATIPSGDREVVAAFSPVQPLLAFSTAIGVTSTKPLYGVRFWDARSRQMVGEELPVSGQCRGLVFSGDGRTLLTWTTDDQLTRWEIPGGRRLSACPAAAWLIDATPFPLALTQDGQFAAYATRTGGIRVIDLWNGRDQWTAKPPEYHVMALAFSPDGKILASGAGGAASSIRIRFWDVPSGQPIGQPLGEHRTWVSTLVFWPDGKTLASASADQTIRLWDLSDMNHVKPVGRPLRGHKLEVWRLVLLPDHKTLVSGSKDGCVYVWDTAALRDERTPIALPPKLKTWGFGVSGASVITVDGQGQVAQWQGPDFREPQPLIELGTNTFGICLSREGRLLAAGSTNGVVQVWDLEKRTVLKELTAQTMRTAPWGFLPQGHTLAILHPDDKTFYFWDLATWKETHSWSAAVLPDLFGVAVSPDERWCLLWNWAGASSLIEMATGRNLSLNLNLRQAHGAAFSPDGQTFAIASALGFVRLWETAAWREVKILRGVLTGLHSVAFSPDGGRLAAGSNAQEAVKLWDAKSHHELLTLEAQGSRFIQTAFSPEGDVLGSVSKEGFLHLWRAPSWAEIEATEKQGGSYGPER